MYKNHRKKNRKINPELKDAVNKNKNLQQYCSVPVQFMSWKTEHPKGGGRTRKTTVATTNTRM